MDAQVLEGREKNGNDSKGFSQSSSKPEQLQTRAWRTFLEVNFILGLIFLSACGFVTAQGYPPSLTFRSAECTILRFLGTISLSRDLAFLAFAIRAMASKSKDVPLPFSCGYYFSLGVVKDRKSQTLKLKSQKKKVIWMYRRYWRLNPVQGRVRMHILKLVSFQNFYSYFECISLLNWIWQEMGFLRNRQNWHI